MREFFKSLRDPLLETSFGDFSILLMFYSLLIVVAAYIFSRLLNGVLKKRVFKKYALDLGTSSAYARILHYFIMFIAFVSALNTMGFKLSVLLASSAALLVGIGFGIQQIANNFISGIIILFERPVKVGDFIEVEGILGTVTDINTRSSKITTNDQITIIVPNSHLLENNVINWSYNRYTRINIEIGVAYGSDLELVRQTLLKVGLENKTVLRKPYPEVFCERYADSAIELTLLVWIKDQYKYRIVKSQINFEISKAFDQAGIRIPFPQRDIHLRSIDRVLPFKNIDVPLTGQEGQPHETKGPEE